MGRERRGYGEARNGNAPCTKNSPKYMAFGDAPWGATTPVSSYTSRNLFSATTFPSQIVCLYLEPFKSRASNLTILKKSPKSIWNYCGYPSRVANFVESRFESSFELLEFVNDDILLQQRFSIFAYNYVVHLHISSA